MVLAASEIIATQPPAQPRPGILIVTLHEGSGLSLPDLFDRARHNSKVALQVHTPTTRDHRHPEEVLLEFLPTTAESRPNIFHMLC